MGKTDIEQYIWQDRERFYRLAFTYVRNREDALDIVSESIVKAIKNHRRLRDEKAVTAWFFSIVTRTALDFIRRRKRTAPLVQVPEQGIEDRHQDPDLMDAMACLPEELRMIVILRFFEDMKIAEIAQVLRQNENTVKSRLYRALGMLKIELTEPEETQDPAGGLA